ncbi:Flp family type IVb pilin [Shewanella sp. D64]|uniref:Flp family type IVb pilin n=1 Tax=unclassified Shewanella TaxID=196818 RepID=UPI0022BA2CBA|nr:MULTISPECIES: Flp family type IVb pilin [unclassified Shewanella]MEC4725702.1 Flp family type IVb pilin [Shewanella sp. D64]MEC4737691.1 Flp family type IVb pilin [Shewanella sp. E94]WBJ93498.1 Flp family type IVb pilin [Shewanella sp. MTB7]
MIKYYCNAMAFLATYKKDERGVTAIEYGLIGVAMASLLAVVFAATGDESLIAKLTAAFTAITDSIGKVTTAAAP